MLRSILFLLAAAVILPAQITVLNHVRLIDGSGAAPIEDAAVVMAGGKIRDIGPVARVKIPAGAEVLDLKGKTVTPGIINLHGHVGNVEGLVQDRKFFTRENVIRNLRTYARYGVTTTTSMGADEDLIVEIRDDIRRGRVLATRVFTALQGFTTRNGYPTHAPGIKGVAQELISAAQAKAWVDKLADNGADCVKMWVDSHHGAFEKLTPSMYGAIIKQAHKRGLIAFAHVYELGDAKGLVDAGIDVLAHSVRDREVDDELIQKMIRNGVYYAATLSREQSTFCYADPPKWLDEEFFRRAVDDAVVREVKTKLKAAQSNEKTIAQGKSDFEMASRNLKKISAAGVLVGFGTDSGPPGRFPGFFEHWEAELMVAAGMTPMEVITAWSKTSAKALGREKELGVLRKGMAADLVVLNENPLDDIRNTRTIHAVYLGGKKFE